MKGFLLVAALTLSLALYGAAGVRAASLHLNQTQRAQRLSDSRVGSSKPELKAQMAFSGFVVSHFQKPAFRWRLLPRHATCWSHVPSGRLRRVCDQARTKFLAHRWLLAVAKARWEKLYAPKPAVAVTGHYAGWACITNGAYPGAAHEGNGYNGAYTGPLGMTTPWAGHMPPGSDWVHSDVSAVYAIAESVAAAHGWSYSWMQGQWPNTFPPCAGFFH